MNVPLTNHTLKIANKEGEEIGCYSLNLESGEKLAQKVVGTEIDAVYTPLTKIIQASFVVAEDMQSVKVQSVNVTEKETLLNRWIVRLLIGLIILASISGLIYWLIKKKKLN